MVDDDFGLADLGKGVTAPAELGAQRILRGRHPHRVDRVLLGNGEGLAQRRGVGAGRFVEAGQADFGKTIDRARFDVEGHREGAVGGGVDLGGHQRVVIAVGTQQLGEQLGVGAGAAIDLRGVGGIVAIFLEGGKLAELGEQSGRVDSAQPFDPVAVGASLAGVGDPGFGRIRNRAVLTFPCPASRRRDRSRDRAEPTGRAAPLARAEAEARVRPAVQWAVGPRPASPPSAPAQQLGRSGGLEQPGKPLHVAPQRLAT